MEGQKMPKKKDQAINNDLQYTTQETKDLATRTSLISGVNTGGFSLIKFYAYLFILLILT
jgi:hypothetical protein